MKGKGRKPPTKGKGRKPIRPKPKPKPKPNPSGGTCKKPSLCSIKDNAANSLCKYAGPAKGCNPKFDMAAFKAAVMTEHNNIRKKVASGGYAAQSLPKATGSGIPPLQWDEGLACLAQRWVEQCVSGHDKSRKTDKFSYVGQNAYKYWSSKTVTPSPTFGSDATKAWFEGELPDWHKFQGSVKQFTKSSKTYSGKYPKFWMAVGHLTQVIWAKSTHIGCGMAVGAKGTYVVCNYGPAGNFINQPIYPS